MPITMTARYRVRPEKVAECKQTVIEFVKYIRAHEPTTLFYMAIQEIIDPASFVHTMVFEDDRAITLHQSSPATKRFVDTIYPAAEEPLHFQEYRVLGFKADEDIGSD